MFRKLISQISHIAMRICLALIACYQKLIRPFLGYRCRFYPSCSEYAVESITTYSLGKGLYLSVRRILRCHPFHQGGYDPVIRINNERV